jgi:hypothetical protein
MRAEDPSVGGGGRRVTPPESSAWIVGRASAIGESSAAGARLNFGGPASSESRGVASDWGEGVDGVDDADAEDERRRAIVAELLGSTEALAELPESPAGEDAVLEALSEPDDALRNFGRSLSSLLLEELVDELAVLSSELDDALCNFGRSGSSLLLEVAELSSELELARRSLGRSPDAGVSGELPAELVDEGFVMGRVGSSVA